MYTKLSITIIVCSIAFLFVHSSFNKDKNFGDRKFQATINRKKPLNWPWKGVVIVTHGDIKNVTAQNIHELKKAGVNFINLSLGIRNYKLKNKISAEQAIIETFEFCDKVIQYCKNEGIVVMICFHQYPIESKDNITQSSSNFWNSPELLNESLKFIDRIVLHFDHWDNVVGYDFFSEPLVRDGKNKMQTPDNWNSYFLRMAKLIRQKSSKYISYTPGPGGLASGYKDMHDTIEVENIIYNFHFYAPHQYTHQGVRDNFEKYKYPGIIGVKYWDFNSIKATVKIPFDWCKRNNQLLYVGEFSASVYAEGREKYLDDVMTAFDDCGISYSYFSYNGWLGWRANYVLDSKSNKLVRATMKTEAEKVLEKHWRVE